MKLFRYWLARIHGLFSQRSRDRELDAEIESHLQFHIEDNLEHGMTPEEARRQAFLKLGGIESTKEAYRDQRSLPLLETFCRDLIFAARVLRRNRGFTLAAVLTLAIGIGATIAIFGLINTLLLKPLPVHKPEELTLLASHDGQDSKPDYGFYYRVYEKLRRQNTILADIAASAPVSLNVTARGVNESSIPGQLISGNYLSLLGINPVVGRNIHVDDDQTPGGHPVAMISHEFWRTRFGMDKSAVGQTIHINGTPFTIVGILPREFFGTEVGRAPHLLLPIMMQAEAMPAAGSWLNNPVNVVNWLQLIGRLKTDSSVGMAQNALDTIYRGIMADEATAADPKWANALKESKLLLTPGARGISALRSQFAEPLGILLVVVSLVLLIACANIANLLLARSESRRREMAVRLAIGANRSRLIRQLLTENLLLTVTGACLGLILAHWAGKLLVNYMSTGRAPITLNLQPDALVMTFVTALSALTALLFGLAPALRSTRLDLTPALKQAGGNNGSGGTGTSASNLLVVVQVAISLVLLFGAGLFMRSLSALTSNSNVTSPNQLLVARLEPKGSDQKHGTNAVRLKILYQSLQDHIAAIPGVKAASLASVKPTEIITPNRKIQTVLGQELDASMIQIFPQYFTALGLPILAGRDITSADNEPSAPQVALINETLARKAFPNQNPIGREFRFGRSGPNVSIIGVVQDSKYGHLRGDTVNAVYQPYLQANTGRGQMALHVHTSGPAMSRIPEIQKAILQTDPGMPAFTIQTLATEFDAVLIRERLLAALSAFFGGTALVLACIGLYGLLAYGVAQRKTEIGIRMALGAQQWDVLASIISRGLKLTFLGILVGLVSAFALAQLVRKFLYGVQAIDPIVAAIACLVLASVALAASWLPARRAARMNPINALRHE